MSLDDAARAVLDRSDHLHVMGTALFSPTIVEVVLGAAEAIKARGRHDLIRPQFEAGDPEPARASGSVRNAVPPLRRLSAERLGALLVHGRKTEKAAIAEILDRGVRTVVHKRGPEGASYFDAATHLTQSGFAVEEVDPTGAGDSFGATFISCWLRGAAPALCLAYAAASGALAVTRQGPMEGAASQAELDAFLAKRLGKLS